MDDDVCLLVYLILERLSTMPHGLGGTERLLLVGDRCTRWGHFAYSTQDMRLWGGTAEPKSSSFYFTLSR